MKGKTLGCHCEPQWCHGYVLAALAESCDDEEFLALVQAWELGRPSSGGHALNQILDDLVEDGTEEPANKTKALAAAARSKSKKFKKNKTETSKKRNIPYWGDLIEICTEPDSAMSKAAGEFENVKVVVVVIFLGSSGWKNDCRTLVEN